MRLIRTAFHFSFFLMSYTIVDIETTGGNSGTDKITEIAIYRHDGEKIVDEFVSLVNPERSIPPYISRLTGITDEMVADAPKFYELAKQIVQITDGAVFVAHNVAFDYGFVREEFKSLGFNFSRDHLCTVKLSRKLIPGFRSYSLGNLCQDLGIGLENRHRASGDALATVKLFELLLQKDDDGIAIGSLTKNDYLNLRFPPNFDKKILDTIPEEAGVYYFHNMDGSIIYIGKSNNIRKRILTHFSNKQTRKAIELRNSIHDVSFEVTGSELVALLLESEEIKTNQPVFNRAQKKMVFNYGIFSDTDEKGYRTIRVAKVTDKKHKVEDPILTTSSANDAQLIIDKLMRQFQLCQKLCGEYKIAHACFGYSLHQCLGACIGKESPESYNERAEKAIESLHYKNPNFMIVGRGRTTNERSIVHVEKGRYLGFGFFDIEFTAPYPDSLRDVITFRQDNRDVHRIIRHFLTKTSQKDILVY